MVAGIRTSRGPKSGKGDAYALAEKLRVGNLEEHVLKAPRQITRLRELSRIHMTLVGDVVRTQARVKSLCRSHGVMVEGLDIYSALRRKDWQNQLDSSSYDGKQPPPLEPRSLREPQTESGGVSRPQVNGSSPLVGDLREQVSELPLGDPECFCGLFDRQSVLYVGSQGGFADARSRASSTTH